MHLCNLKYYNWLIPSILYDDNFFCRWIENACTSVIEWANVFLRDWKLFLETTAKYKKSENMSDVHYICCPCVDWCTDKKTRDIEEIHEHLLVSGFTSGYICWTEHGEYKEVVLEDTDVRGNLVTALLHIEILEPNSKLASKLCRVYTRNEKNVVLIYHPERNSQFKWIFILINKNKELMYVAFVLWTLYFTSSTRICMRSRK
jgi:hypothetical protein